MDKRSTQDTKIALRAVYFLSRINIATLKRDIDIANVRPSVCLSRPDIVSKRINVSSFVRSFMTTCRAHCVENVESEALHGGSRQVVSYWQSSEFLSCA